MNGKAAKLLRSMGRSDKKSKRAFKSLTQHQRALVRKLFNQKNYNALASVAGR